MTDGALLQQDPTRDASLQFFKVANQTIHDLRGMQFENRHCGCKHLRQPPAEPPPETCGLEHLESRLSPLLSEAPMPPPDWWRIDLCSYRKPSTLTAPGSYVRDFRQLLIPF